MRAQIDGDVLLVSVDTDEPGPFDGEVALTGPAGAATVAVRAVIIVPAQASPEAAESSVADESPAETPAAETPAAETPAAETPAAETPAAETPAAETPTAETPAAETPVAETPAAETPLEVESGVVALKSDETAPTAVGLQTIGERASAIRRWSSVAAGHLDRRHAIVVLLLVAATTMWLSLPSLLTPQMYVTDARTLHIDPTDHLQPDTGVGGNVWLLALAIEACLLAVALYVRRRGTSTVAGLIVASALWNGVLVVRTMVEFPGDNVSATVDVVLHTGFGLRVVAASAAAAAAVLIVADHSPLRDRVRLRLDKRALVGALMVLSGTYVLVFSDDLLKRLDASSADLGVSDTFFEQPSHSPAGRWVVAVVFVVVFGALALARFGASQRRAALVGTAAYAVMACARPGYYALFVSPPWADNAHWWFLYTLVVAIVVAAAGVFVSQAQQKA
jgi:hypothetical protein